MMEENAGYLIKLVANSLNRMLDQEMAPLDLTAMQWRPIAMVALGRADTPAELARLNGVDTGAMTRTLDRLEAKGLLRRARNQLDRRVVDRIDRTGRDQGARNPAQYRPRAEPPPAWFLHRRSDAVDALPAPHDRQRFRLRARALTAPAQANPPLRKGFYLT